VSWTAARKARVNDEKFIAAPQTGPNPRVADAKTPGFGRI